MSSDELEPEHMRKIFIGGLDRETTNETLRPPFEPFGEIVDCVVIREGKTHGSRGFGFVTYATSSAVDDVMKQKVGFKVDGRVVDLKRAVPRDEPISASSTKVFVGGLPLSVDNDRLREYFSDFGEVAQTEVMRDRDGTSRGFGFVTFLDSDVVNKLANQKRVEIDGKVAEVKKAEPKGAVRPSPGGRRGEDRYDDYPPSRGRDYYGYDSYPRDMPHHHPHHHPHHQPHGRSDYQGSASMPPRGGYSGDFSYPYHGGYSGGPAAAAAAAAAAAYGSMGGYQRDVYADYSRSPGYGYPYAGTAAPAGRNGGGHPGATAYPVGSPYAQSPYSAFGAGQMRGYGSGGSGGGGSGGGASGAGSRYRPY